MIYLFMKVYYLKIDSKQKEIKFPLKFVGQNKRKCRIIYKNKSYPLQTKFQIKEKKNSKIKIKLIFYENISDFSAKYLNYYNWLKANERKKVFHEDDLYLKFLLDDPLKVIFRMVYRIDEFKILIKIFGEKFVKNNKYKCLILNKDEIFPLTEYFLFKNIEAIDNKFEILLLELEDIHNRSYMFHECDALLEFSLFQEKNNDIINETTENRIEEENDHEIYLNCTKINTEINKIELSNDISTSSLKIFQNLISMTSDSEKLKFKIQLTDMSYMFSGCLSLKSLPNLSDWKTHNVINMCNLFYSCSSLVSLPDLSNWDTSNVKDMSRMFGECPSLISLPNISNLDTKCNKHEFHVWI